ncbi:MAG: nuclear transport factor 2 family protein [Deltaproteobacteria bacterium]|nr:nuclear transport factor 2 family protein [Deltaproteobacteria bacterium]
MKLASVALVLAVAACNRKHSEEQMDRPTSPPPSDKPAGSAPAPGGKPAPKLGADLGKAYLDCVGLMNEGKVDDVKARCLASSAAYRMNEPGTKISPQLVLVSGRTVLAVNVRHGKLEATGKDVGTTSFERLEFDDDNKIREAHEETDGLTALAQAGKLPKELGEFRGPAQAPEAPEIVVTQNNATEKTNVDVMRKVTDALNAHKAGDFAALFADDAVESDQASAKDRTGKKEIEAGAQEFAKVMPDATMMVPAASQYAAGDYVVAIGTITGTKEKKKVSGTYAEVAKFKDGKVTKLWRFRDGLAFAKQLGLELPKDEPAKPEAPAAPVPAAPAPAAPNP